MSNTADTSNEYTKIYHTDASDVTHTVLYKKSTCTRVDDLVLNFHCSRDSKCVKCQQNYL